MKSQMAIRLKASFTVFDCFNGKIGELIDFACYLKSPNELGDTWLKVVVRCGVPMTWKEIKQQYLDALISIKS